MPHPIDEVVLKPGESIRFEDRDDLLAKLSRLDQRVPSRVEGRTSAQREHYCMVRYLRFLGWEGLLELPVTLAKPHRDPPDFSLEWRDREETFEVTEGTTAEYQKELSHADRMGDQREVLPKGVEPHGPAHGAAELWAETMFHGFRRKAEGLVTGRFGLDHLLLYDITGLGLLVPLEEGGPLLRAKIEAWHRETRPQYRFGKISVLRGLALLLDVTGAPRLLRGESRYYRLSVIQAHDEDDLKRRLREIDRYCRRHSIRRLKLFGSVLGDLETAEPAPATRRFRADSDVDLLVEFEPGAVVTLLDMARMERELSELIGFEVDLRTAGDLSRYFREDVLTEAVDLHARSA